MDIPDSAILPEFGRRPGVPAAKQLPLPIAEDSITRITEKMVRGIFYLEDKKFIEPPYSISVLPLDPSVGRNLRAIIDRFAQIYAREPGIIVRRAVAVEDGISAAFAIEIWGQFKIYAFVDNERRARQLSEGTADSLEGILAEVA